MSRVFTFLVLLIFVTNANSQTPNWILTVNGTGAGYGYGSGLAIDTSGNLYLTGRVAGNMTLGGLSLTSSGTVPFAGKYDNAGNGKWLTSNYPYNQFSYGDAICVDKSGRSYITSCDGSGDGVYIQGFNSAGNVAWSKISYNSNCRGYGITADNFWNIYSAGHYTGSSITFGAKTLPNNGAYSGYLLKQDTAGNYKWATYFSSTSGTYTTGKHVVTDKEGNIYVCGAYQGAAIFYSANSATTITAPSSTATGGFSDLFVAKYDSSGNVLWVTTAANAGLSNNSYYYSNVLAIDSCENVFVAGIFQNTATFGSLSVTSSGSHDVFVAKYSRNGTWEWVQTGGGSGDDYATGITVDKNNDVYVAGDFANGSAKFDSIALTGDVYVAKYANSNGDLLWVQDKTVGGGFSGIVVDKQKFVYVDGDVNPNAPFITKLDTVAQRAISPVLNSSYCPGSSVTIPYVVTGSFNSGNVFTVQLSDSTGSFVADTSIGSITSTGNGIINATIPANTPNGSNYLIRVVSSNPATSSYTGCSGILIGGGLSVKVSNDTSVCSGSSVLLAALGGSSYAWSPSTGLTCTTCAASVATPLATTTYTVNVSAGSCAPVTDSVVINVNPSVTINVAPLDTSVCSGSIVAINSTGGSSFSWSPGSSLSDSTIANPIASPTVSTTYVVTGGACSTPVQVVVNVGNAALGGSVTAIRDTICLGTSGTLTLSGNSSNTIQWQSSITNNNYAAISGAPDTVKYRTEPLTQSTYFRAIVGGGNCSAISDTLQLIVPPSLTASFTSTTSGTTVTFNSSGSQGNIRSYYWDFGDNLTSTDTNPKHIYAKDSIYNVCLTIYDGSNCSYTYCRSVALGIETVSAEGSWTIYPDPFGSELNIDGKTLNRFVQNIAVYDVLGRIMFNKSIDKGGTSTFHLNVSTLAKGMYYLVIRTNDADYVQKVVKQ